MKKGSGEKDGVQRKPVPRGDPDQVGARSQGTVSYPEGMADEGELSASEGAGWETTGTDTARIAPKEVREAEERRKLDLTGGGTLDEKLEEPDAEELIQSGPGRPGPKP